MTLLARLTGRRGLGCLADERDPRDIAIGSLMSLSSAPLPREWSLRHPEVTPFDQGATNSCVGQAWAQAIRIAHLTAGNTCPPQSALFSYFLSRASIGIANVDAGSYLRAGAAVARRFGSASAETWPFAYRRVNRSPSFSAFRDANVRKPIAAYYRVYTPDEARMALAAGLPVVGGWQIDREFTESRGPSVIDVPHGDWIGGHAMVLEGYHQDGTFELLNSWGSSWRLDGRAFVTEAFVAAGVDLWAVRV